MIKVNNKTTSLKSHKNLEDLSNKYKNVEAIYDEKSACSWMLASEFTISSNYVTSVEAFILGKPNYNFKPYTNERVEFKLPKITGINVSSTEEMIKKIEDFNNVIPIMILSKNIMKQHFSLIYFLKI